MLIIEICGNPGCGKSTMGKSIQAKLEKQGYKIINLYMKIFYKILWSKSFITRARNKLYVYKSRKYFKNSELMKALSVIRPHVDRDSYDIWSDRILELCYGMIEAKRKGFEIVLCDEGCLQFITSFYHDKEIGDEVTQLVLTLKNMLYKDNIYLMNCRIDIDENYSRLLKRNREGDRFLAGDEAQVKELLSIKQRNIDKVLEIFHQEDMHTLDLTNGTSSVDTIVEEIQSILS